MTVLLSRSLKHFCLAAAIVGSSVAFTPSTNNRIAFNTPCLRSNIIRGVASTSLRESASALSTSTELSPQNKKIAVLICPAQFCVPADYQKLTSLLTSNTQNPNITNVKVAPLPRTEWIKVARQLPTKSFFNAELNNAITLKWYFDAMEQALADLYAETDDDTSICIVSHSIGGWVARAYLGGLSQSSTAVYQTTMERCTSLVTLGSPHVSPETALVDQTRGLLKEVDEAYACSSQGLQERGIAVTCVGSTAVKSQLFTTDVEKLVATTSYLPLVGQWKDVLISNGGTTSDDSDGNSDSDGSTNSTNGASSTSSAMEGDGIIPKELAFMDPPARAIEVERCTVTGNAVRHAHVLPTPWNLWDGYAKSIDLPEDYVWYGSEGVIDQWIDSIQ